jgi:hypothetical protein
MTCDPPPAGIARRSPSKPERPACTYQRNTIRHDTASRSGRRNTADTPMRAMQALVRDPRRYTPDGTARLVDLPTLRRNTPARAKANLGDGSLNSTEIRHGSRRTEDARQTRQETRRVEWSFPRQWDRTAIPSTSTAVIRVVGRSAGSSNVLRTPTTTSRWPRTRWPSGPRPDSIASRTWAGDPCEHVPLGRGASTVGGRFDALRSRRTDLPSNLADQVWPDLGRARPVASPSTQPIVRFDHVTRVRRSSRGASGLGCHRG